MWPEGLVASYASDVRKSFCHRDHRKYERGAESAASAVVFLSACVWLGFWESHEYVGRRGSLTKAPKHKGERDGEVRRMNYEG